MMNELEVRQEAAVMEQEASALSVSTNEEYDLAAAILKKIKQTRANVVDYWKTPKDAASKAHKAICAKEKEMTEVCDSAEKAIKSKMLVFQREQETKRLAELESNKLLEQAAQAEQSGSTLEAHLYMAQAEQVASIAPKIEVSRPNAQGVSTRKIARMRVAKDEDVPAYLNGCCIRTIDEKAILALHKLDPILKVPGVEFYIEESLAVRA